MANFTQEQRLHLSVEKWEEIIPAARQHGFESVQDYLIALHDQALAEEADLPTEATLENDLRAALRDVKAGRIYDSMWGDESEDD